MDLLRKLHPANVERKSAELPFTTDRPFTTYAGGAAWGEMSFDRRAETGYQKNSAVFICISKLVFGCLQPVPRVVDTKGEIVANHPLQRLLDRPNPDMSWQELSIFITTYKAIGGYCCLHKVYLNGELRELWPYHRGQMEPISQGVDWVHHYDFHLPDGDIKTIDPRRVVMLKWPSVDMRRTVVPLSPLEAIGQEYATDSEATRYLYALLANDATPRTVINVKNELSDPKFERLRQQFNLRHGGDNRGGIGIVEGDASISRLSMNLKELAFDALRAVPEARIAAAFNVPAMYAGLNVGLSHSTYSNNQEARRGFIEDTVMQLLALDAGELTADLGAEFGGGVSVEHDYSGVVGLQENEDAKYTRVLSAWEKGAITRNETRIYLGFPRVEDLKLAPGAPELPPGDTFKTATTPALPQLPDNPNIIDVTPEKAARTLLLKALKQASTETTEQAFAKESERLLAGVYNRVAESVRGQGE